jgi:hypothetical protein
MDDPVDQTKKVDNTPCKNLLCIADLEGCLEMSLSKKEQNTIMCQKETFDAIGKYLEVEGNHVAFLGDYFDQGPHMVSSINGIVDLTKKNYGNKVHIILGNRDLNKMRLNIEKDMTETEYKNVWGLWNDALSAGVPVDTLERSKHLLKTTYGAPNLLTHLSTELNMEELNVLNLFNEIFSDIELIITETSEPKDIFVKNCRTLFEKGNLMEKVTVGEKNVLLSHGGSFNAHIFNNNNLPEFDKNKPKDFGEADYFGKMELCRASLDNDSDEETPGAKIDDVISDYNNFYHNVLNNIVKPKSIDEVKDNHNYHMLQAMGLKGNNFASPIESCIFDGAFKTGCTKGSIKTMPAKLNTYFNNQKIHIISHGHVPFCGTVPLIYKNNDIIFVSNDVSNGNRPSSYTKLEQIPLSCISEDKVGICSLKDGSLHTADKTGSDTIKTYKNDNTEEGYYDNFVRSYEYKTDKFITHEELKDFFEDKGNVFPAMKQNRNIEEATKDVAAEGQPEGEQAKHVLTPQEKAGPKEGGKAKSRKGRRTKKGKKGNRKTKKSRKSKRSKKSKK